jgi:endonuclease YncB( thermonuclease family)
MMQQFLFLLLICSFSTINVSCNSKSGKRKKAEPKGVKIRLIGVDAPESRKTFKKEGWLFWERSKSISHKPINRKKRSA